MPTTWALVRIRLGDSAQPKKPEPEALLPSAIVTRMRTVACFTASLESWVILPGLGSPPVLPPEGGCWGAGRTGMTTCGGGGRGRAGGGVGGGGRGVSPPALWGALV